MANRQKLRSEETKRAILSAAGTMFGERGFEAVTMREIAKAADCSHPTIYIYFKDKEELLHELAVPTLLELKTSFENIASQNNLSPEAKLKRSSMEFIRFSLDNKAMYTVLFVARADRVDDVEPELEINRLRIALFHDIGQRIQESLPSRVDEKRMLTFTRIYFFMLNGIVNTYVHSGESYSVLMDRLGSTFEDAFNALIIGFKQNLGLGSDSDEFHANL